MKSKARILHIGPSYTRSHGGMATVIKQIMLSPVLNNEFVLDFFESYVDTNRLFSVLFSLKKFLIFIFTKKNFDVYHIHMASNGSFYRKSLYACIIKIWKKKLVLHIHGGGFIEFYNKSNNKRFITKILKTSNFILVLSENIRNDFLNIFDLDNIYVLHNAVNVPIASTTNTINDTRNNFCFFGKICEEKGVYDLVKSLRIVINSNPEVKCFICGVGESEKLTKLINELHLENNCLYLGWADDFKKEEILRLSTCLVLPSYSEAFPMCILEGMSYGKVIISTEVGAIPEIVKQDNGFLIKPGDIERLSEIILYIASGSCKVSDISCNNIGKIMNNFSLKTVHQKLNSYYKDLLRTNMF